MERTFAFFIYSWGSWVRLESQINIDYTGDIITTAHYESRLFAQKDVFEMAFISVNRLRISTVTQNNFQNIVNLYIWFF